MPRIIINTRTFHLTWSAVPAWGSWTCPWWLPQPFWTILKVGRAGGELFSWAPGWTWYGESFFSSSLMRGQEGMIHFFSILKFHLVPLLETTLVPKTRYLLKKTEWRAKKYLKVIILICQIKSMAFLTYTLAVSTFPLCGLVTRLNKRYLSYQIGTFSLKFTNFVKKVI